uniref:Uncharacterized protein n=2 Tax=Rhizophora mucronata TaxID=61149 RepID=A0A2P2J6Z9_RHIMU
MGFENFEPIIGEPEAEWKDSTGSGSYPLRRFLMHVYAPDYHNLKIHVTDYFSSTFEALKSVVQLEDMRDSIGVGGSWSEFVDYMVASIKSESVKLVLERHSDADVYAKLVAQKSKGMPVISMPLTRVVGSAASDAMANISFELFTSFKVMQNLVVQEQERCSELRRMISTEMERSESSQSQLEKKQKFEKMNLSSKADATAPLAVNGSQNSPDKRAAQGAFSSKVAARVVPVYRRTRVRGALLQDTEHDEDN